MDFISTATSNFRRIEDPNSVDKIYTAVKMMKRHASVQGSLEKLGETYE